MTKKFESKEMNILCYGDSNTWGWVPSSMGLKRYNKENRWPGILQNILGDSYNIMEDGLGARTTSFDDPRPELPLRNGLKTLPIILEAHLPIEIVILMLGTTDTKEMLNISVKQTTQSMKQIIQTIKEYRTLENTQNPKILLIVPPIVKEIADFASKLFKGATKKTTQLIESYKELAKEENIFYLNPNDKIKVDEIEGVHIDNDNHKILGKLVANKILEINTQ